MNDEANEADQQYNGEFRYVNLGPAQARRLLGTETDPEERVALETALKFWAAKGPAREVSAGQPYRGEPREAIHAESMHALASQVSPVEHVFVGPMLSTGGASVGASPNDEDIYDWDMLMFSNL
jgi:hypothetical protein